MLSVDLVPCFLVLILLLFTRIKKQDSISNVLSMYHTTLIKGLASINVVLCHLSFFYDGIIVLPAFNYIGYASVGFFFFLSGFGLMKQYLQKEDYRSTFLKKRLGRIFIPYIFFNLIYWLYYLMTGTPIGVFEACRMIVSGDPLVLYSWYILEILIIYLFFFLFMFFVKRRKMLMIVCNIILYLLLLLFYKQYGYLPFWYDSTHMFFIGIIWASYEERLTKFVYKYWYACLAFSILGIILSFGNVKMHYLLEMSFMLLVLALFSIFQFKNTILEFLGRISMETYLIHGLVIKFVRYYICLDEGPFDMVIIIFLSILSAFILNTLIKKLNRFILYR